MDWLVAWLLEKTYQYSLKLQKNGASTFDIRNNTQVFYAQSLAIAYGQVDMTFKLITNVSNNNFFDFILESYFRYIFAIHR